MGVPEEKMWYWVPLGWLGLERPIREASATVMWMRRQRETKVNWPHLYFNWGWVAWEERQWYSDFIEDSATLSGRRFAFFGTMGSRWRSGIPLARGKVFVTQEDTQTRFLQYDDYLASKVDLSLGFKPDDETRGILRFPIWYEWLLFPSVRFAELEASRNQRWSPRGFVEAIEAWDGTEDRERFAGLVASHDNRGNGAGLRRKMHGFMTELAEVVCAGKLLHNSNVLKEEFGDRIVPFLETCRFNICFENVSADHYCTEKLFQAFLAGSIPVYWGFSANPEPEILTGNGIVFFDRDHPKDTMELIERLWKDVDFRKEWMSKPKFKPNAVSLIEGRMLRLEAELLRIAR